MNPKSPMNVCLSSVILHLFGFLGKSYIRKYEKTCLRSELQFLSQFRHARSNRARDPRADSQGAKDPLLKKQRYEDAIDDGKKPFSQLSLSKQ